MCESIIRDLKERGFKLAGSRRMAEKYPDRVVVKEDTDWDLYAPDCSETRRCLAELGFELLDCPNRDYWDELLDEIYTHPQHPIQALLRHDAHIYEKAFESIDADTFITELWKSSPTRVDEMSKIQFAAKVCAHFNRLFFENGYVPRPKPEIPNFDDAPL